MASFNQVVLVGNLTRDPELRYTPGENKAVCGFTLAVDTGAKKENAPSADFIPVTVWDKAAEACAAHLKKGASVLVSGRIKSERWEKDGQKRSRLGIVARSVKFLSSPRKDAPTTAPAAASGSIPEDVAEILPGEEEEILDEQMLFGG